MWKAPGGFGNPYTSVSELKADKNIKVVNDMKTGLYGGVNADVKYYPTKSGFYIGGNASYTSNRGVEGGAHVGVKF